MQTHRLGAGLHSQADGDEMTFLVTVNGADVSSYVEQIVRDVSMCEVSCGVVLQLDPRAPSMNPYHSVTIDMDGTRIFTGLVNGTAERLSAGKWVRQVTCDHLALKRLKDYFYHETFNTGNSDYVIGALIGYISGKAGVTINWVSGTADAVCPRNWVWTDVSLLSFLMDLALFGGLQIKPEQDGTILLTKAALSSSYTSLGPTMIARERRVDDSLFRSRVVLYGATGDPYIASGSNPYGYTRSAIVANLMIHTAGQSEDVGDAMLAEFNQLLDIEKTTIAGKYNIPVTSTVLLSDPKDSYSATRIVTRTNDTYKPDSSMGNLSTITTNERCPKIYGFDYTLPPPEYEHKPLAVGISKLVQEGTPEHTARVYVTPDITQSWYTSSGSGFHEGTGACEWYNCSQGLSGDFAVVCFGSDCGYSWWAGPAIIRDHWSDDARGAWCHTSSGLFYTPKLLPPTSQSSGSWEYTPWTRLPNSGSLTVEVRVETKSNDSSGIYISSARSWQLGGLWYTQIRVEKIDRSGNRTLIADYPTDPDYQAGVKLIASFTRPHSSNTQYVEFDTYINATPPSSPASFANDSIMVSSVGYADYSEADTSGNLLTVSTDTQLYTGASGASVLSTYPNDEYGQWTRLGNLSFDAKYERLYIPVTSLSTGRKSVIRSDDQGVSWSRRATSGSTVTYGMYGVISSRILAYNITPYVSTYCITAISGINSPTGVFTLLVSSDDGNNFYSSGSFSNQIRCIMDMDV